MATEIAAIEYYLPRHVVTNLELASEFPDWDMAKVEEKSGVLQRYVAEPDETALDLAIRACDKLFSHSSIPKTSIDGIIFCTQSPDYIMPSNAFLLQRHLALRENILAFDYNLACSGYIYGLAMARGFIETKVASTILLVTAETYSKHINPRDRSTRTLFSDAAAATIITASKTPGTDMVDVSFASSGDGYDSFYIPGGGCRIPKSAAPLPIDTDRSGNVRTAENIHMNGFSVWKFISRAVPVQILELLDRNNIGVADVDMFIFHQASKLTLDSLIKALKLPPEKVFINLDRVGNCVSASIPIALKDAEDLGRVKKGNLIVLSGFGVGLSWGSLLIRY